MTAAVAAAALAVAAVAVFADQAAQGDPDASSATGALPELTPATPRAVGSPEAFKPVHVAHRGGAGLAPEMTAAAFESARKYDPDFVEIDVQLSSDGVPVLVHDETLARTSDVATVYPGREYQPVGDFTLKQLRRLDFGSWFGESYAGESIVTLEELPDFIYSHGIGVFIELKLPEESPGLEQAVSDVMDADPRWAEMAAADRVYFISFDRDALERAAKLQPDPSLIWLSPHVPDDSTLADVAGWSAQIGADHRHADDSDLRRIRAAGLAVALWTVNTKEALKRVIEQRIDFVITDRPDLLHGLIEQG
ncbi:MAG: glycerophosphodiester phosphodiesterase [Stackebrandtia sp.]